MKSLHSLFGCLAVLAVLASTSGAFGVYTQIQNNSYDGVKDLDYDGSSVSYLTTDSEPNSYNVLTLLDDSAPGGSLDSSGIAFDITLSLTSSFQDFNSTVADKAYFTGGLLSLTFNYYDYGTSGVTSYALAGKVTEGTLEVTSAGPSLSAMTGIFLFDTNDGATGIENLPGSGIWPATGLSSAVNLTFAINTDLSSYMTDASAWNNPMPGENVYDTQFSLLPNEQPIPEPGALMLALLGMGGFAMRRSRKA